MRTLFKTGSYAAMHLTVAVIVAFVLTGDWVVALSIGMVEPAVQTLFFALHERLWERRKPAKAEAAAGEELPLATAAAR